MASGSGSIPLDYQVLRESVHLRDTPCPVCQGVVTCKVQLNRIEKNGRLVREWERAYCGPCGERAYDQAREECYRKLYANRRFA